MENQYALMAMGFVNALSPMNIVIMIASVTMGIVIGCMPGLSAAMGVALLLPLTFGMEPSAGLIMLGGIYCGAIFGGSISAILIHTPGTPASAATALDGYELTKQGRAGKALGTACTASFFGGLLSCISLYFFAPLLAELAMKFGSPNILLASSTHHHRRRHHRLHGQGPHERCLRAHPLHHRHGPDGRDRALHVVLMSLQRHQCHLRDDRTFSMSQVFILMEKAIKERGAL